MQGLHSAKQRKRWNVILKANIQSVSQRSLFSETSHCYCASLHLLRVKLKPLILTIAENIGSALSRLFITHLQVTHIQ